MKLNWNFKMWGAIGIVACLLMASGLYLSTTDRDTESVSVLARVNDEGSGIFIKESLGIDLDIHDPENWDGLIFMTPGPSSIQHMILSDIVKGLELKFAQRGTPSGPNTVYWTQVAPGLMVDYMFNSDKDVDGGIAWEPHFSVALDYNKDGDRCKKVATTDEYNPDHPCCVIAANNTFLSKNEDATQRFLAGYAKSVQWINATLDAGSGSDFKELVDMTIDIGTPKIEGKDQMPEFTAKKALYNIKFTYELNHGTTTLADQYVEIMEVYEKLGIIVPEVLTKAGFETPGDFAEHLIQDQYLAEVFDGDGNLKSSEELGYTGGITTVKVAYLAADIHQLALHIGKAKGFFEEYGIHVDLKGPYGAGGDVMNALLSKHADVGFVGSPPVVSSSFNALRS